MKPAAYQQVEAPPILVDSKTASRCCSMSVSLWNQLSSAGRTPMPAELNSKKLWSYRQLQLWADAGCPSRTSEKWELIL